MYSWSILVYKNQSVVDTDELEGILNKTPQVDAIWVGRKHNELVP